MVEKMDFSVTSRQLTLLYRLFNLGLDLINGVIKHEVRETDDSGLEGAPRGEAESEENEDGISLGGCNI